MGAFIELTDVDDEVEENDNRNPNLCRLRVICPCDLPPEALLTGEVKAALVGLV